MEYILGKDGAKLIVPTELTENTEAYGLKLFESTEMKVVFRMIKITYAAIHSYILQAIISVPSVV